MKPVRKATVKRTDGKMVRIDLRLEFDATKVPAARQTLLWEALGATLAAALLPEEAEEFLAQLKKATTPAKRKAGR